MKLDRKQIEADFRTLIGPLCDAVGPSGFEDEVADLLRKELADCDVELSDDVMGNLIAYKKGNKRGSVLIAAHMDEIGLIVRHIGSKGFLWVETLGGIAPQQFFGKHVIIKTETGHVDGIVQSLDVRTAALKCRNPHRSFTLKWARKAARKYMRWESRKEIPFLSAIR